MAYLQIENFKNGLDRRRPRVAGPTGTCWDLINAHISRGGDIERRKKFVPTFDAMAETVGLAAVGSELYVFGSGTIPYGLNGLLRYQQLAPVGAGTLDRILDYTTYRGKLYVVARFTNGDIFHYYDGVRVSDWDTVADANTSFEALAKYMADLVKAESAVITNHVWQSFFVTAREKGTPFTISASTDGSGTVTATVVQPNVVEVQEVRASAIITITGGTSVVGADNVISSVKAAGVELLAAPVAWQSTNEATAVRLQAAITANALTTGYDATVSDNVVTVRAAPGVGAAANTRPLVIIKGADVTLTASSTFTGGVNYVAPMEQIALVSFSGTFLTTDTYKVVVNGVEYAATARAAGTGRTAWTFKSRVWSTSRTLLRYCMLNNPMIWDPANGTPDNDAGAIDTSAQNGGHEDLTTVVEYNGTAVLFSRNYGRVWTLETDPTNNAFVQTIENSGTIALQSVVSYGNTDVFYLSDTGVRSVRARAATNTAAVSDVGTAIDVFIHEYMATLPGTDVMNSMAVVEPTEGRFWLAMANRIFVLSYFPTPNISAWSLYELDFKVEAIAKAENLVYVRGDDDVIYLYGGRTGLVYPDEGEDIVTVSLPFTGAQRPADVKRIFGFDMACKNEWAVDILANPNDENQRINAGLICGTTYNIDADVTPGRAALFAFNMVCSGAGEASISSMALHYEKAEEPG